MIRIERVRRCRSRATPVSCLVLAAAAALFAGCEAGHEAPARQVPGGDPVQGRDAIVLYGCGACHTVPGVDRATGRVAPSLAGFAERAFVAGVLANRPDELIRWIQDPPAVNPQTAMPNLGVSAAEARHIAAYLYTLR